jgi:hypothetical protein
MANIKISALPSLTSGYVGGTDVFPINNLGTTKKVTPYAFLQGYASIASANGFAGTWGASGAATLTTPITGILKGSASALAAATTTDVKTLLGTLNVADGGTGTTSHTANNLLVGNGTSPIVSIAPSTSGNILTSNGTSWASTAPPAASALVWLGTITAAGGGSVDFTSLITSTYDDYKVVFDNVVPAGAGYLTMLLSTDNGSTWLTPGYLGAFSGVTQAASVTNGVFLATAVTVGTNQSISTTVAHGGISGHVMLYGVNSTTTGKHFTGSHFANITVSTFTTGIFGGWHSGTAAVNAVRFVMSAGLITQGTFRIYGIKKS